MGTIVVTQIGQPGVLRGSNSHIREIRSPFVICMIYMIDALQGRYIPGQFDLRGLSITLPAESPVICTIYHKFPRVNMNTRYVLHRSCTTYDAPADVGSILFV